MDLFYMNYLYGLVKTMAPLLKARRAVVHRMDVLVTIR